MASRFAAVICPPAPRLIGKLLCSILHWTCIRYLQCYLLLFIFFNNPCINLDIPDETEHPIPVKVDRVFRAK